VRTHAPVALFDALEPGYDEAPTEEEPETEPPQRHEPAPLSLPTQSAVGESSGRRKGRAAMPSWDEIVFGARTEE
jgi:hypothetical protein